MQVLSRGFKESSDLVVTPLEIRSNVCLIDVFYNKEIWIWGQSLAYSVKFRMPGLDESLLGAQKCT